MIALPLPTIPCPHCHGSGIWESENTHFRSGATIDRFWTKVDRSGSCWLWLGQTTQSGYGRFYDKRLVQAHRWSYEAFIGPIPDGLFIDHLCRNPQCVNPAHLEPVTPRENVMRGNGPAARYARRTHCKNGHPFDSANSVIEFRIRTGSPYRRCRACNRDTKRRIAIAKREAAQAREDDKEREAGELA